MAEQQASSWPKPCRNTAEPRTLLVAENLLFQYGLTIWGFWIPVLMVYYSGSGLQTAGLSLLIANFYFRVQSDKRHTCWYRGSFCPRWKCCCWKLKMLSLMPLFSSFFEGPVLRTLTDWAVCDLVSHKPLLMALRQWLSPCPVCPSDLAHVPAQTTLWHKKWSLTFWDMDLRKTHLLF